LEACRKASATLLIAKLDRLARNCAFISGLIESGCEFVAVDMPHANKTMLQIFSAMSEWEGDQISARTKAALAAAKARGVVLGATGLDNLRANIQQRQATARAFVASLRARFEEFRRLKFTHARIAIELNASGVRSSRGHVWTPAMVDRIVHLLAIGYDRRPPKPLRVKRTKAK
jgi:DNA invertase Pin-like site-specific DNA recombinase